jgi:hypothetical protein
VRVPAAGNPLVVVDALVAAVLVGLVVAALAAV